MPAIDAWNIWNFITVLVLVFSFFLLLTGAFTAYFGSGKSRKVGVGLLVGGLVLGLVWIVVFGITRIGAGIVGSDVGVVDIILQSLGIILAAIIGAAAAIGLFLMAIMKS